MSKESCRCAACVSACKRCPGMMSPDDARKAIDSGVSGRRMLGEADPAVGVLLAEINLMKEAYRRLNDDFTALRISCTRLGVQLDAATTELGTIREEVSRAQETAKQFTETHTAVLLDLRVGLRDLRVTVDGLPFRRGNTPTPTRRAAELDRPPTSGGPAVDPPESDPRFGLVDF